MKKLFEQVNVGGIPSKNRIVRSATQEGLAIEDGHIGEELISIYEDLARGGVGVIITSMVGVDENSRVFPKMINADSNNETFIQELKQIVDIVHENNSKIVVQLAHNGAKANPDGNMPLAPSSMSLGEKKIQGMTTEEIRTFINSFAVAALRCQEAGADGIQIHGSHGYLLSQFLSPYFNKRTDEYGGSIENRARIVFELYDEVRNVVGDDYPIWIKINSADYVDEGLSFEESLWVCRELDRKGINGIEVSGGIGISLESAPTRVEVKNKDKGTFSEYALRIAEEVKTTVISVGGYRTVEMMEQWLNKGEIEAISLCRPLICEPSLPKLWNETTNEPRKSRCVSCNKCFDYSNGFGCKVF